MAVEIQSSGDIETICETPGLTSGQTARVVFRAWDDVSPPFTIKVRAPHGKIILDRVLRDLPTGRPQSAPPVTFTVPTAGDYHLTIGELYGKSSGEATLTVTD